MMDTRRDFSFTDPVHRQKGQLEFAEWAEGIKVASRYSYFGKSGGEGHKFGPWARTNPRSSSDGEEFRWLVKQEVGRGGGDDSDTPSPPLWENTGSPEAATTDMRQMIAGYRQEMLNLVRDAPESAYELSLTDMVELKRAGGAVREAPAPPVVAKSESRKTLSRSGSLDSAPRGFLLNMFLPFSLRGKRDKRSCSSSKVSSLGVLACGSWWNKKEFGSRSSSNRKGKRSGWRLAGCFSFCFHTKGGRRCE